MKLADWVAHVGSRMFKLVGPDREPVYCFGVSEDGRTLVLDGQEATPDALEYTSRMLGYTHIETFDWSTGEPRKVLTPLG